jgi:hypothetical protein
VPAPTLLAYIVGTTLFAAGVGLMIHRTRSAATASAGGVLLLLTVFFYCPILVNEIGSPLALEGINYVGRRYFIVRSDRDVGGFRQGRTYSL